MSVGGGGFTPELNSLEAARQKPESAKVSLITVTYNSRSALESFWSDYDPSWGQWIVVDNSSSDGSADTARALGAIVVELDDNVGFSAANNVGADRAEGEVLIFCNPDVEVDATGIQRLLQQAISRPCLVAPQLLNEDGSLQENGRGAPYPHRKVRHMLLKGRQHENSYLRFAKGDGLLSVVWVMGAAVAVSRKTFAEIGGWNSSYFIYYEDAEICLRALGRGVPTFVDGGVRWRHGWARETASGFSRRAWMNELRSGLRFYTSNWHALVPIGRRGAVLRSADRGGTSQEESRRSTGSR